MKCPREGEKPGKTKRKMQKKRTKMRQKIKITALSRAARK